MHQTRLVHLDSSSQISMITSYLSVDATAGTLVADWYPLPEYCPTPEAVVDIYFDR